MKDNAIRLGVKGPNSDVERRERPAPELGAMDLALALAPLIQRVDKNISQEIIVITADKARLCLLEALDRVERRKAWIAPAGILATLLVVFPTTTFQDFLGLSKECWQAIFLLATVRTGFWLTFCLFQIRTSLTVEQIVDRLRTDCSTDLAANTIQA